MFTPPLLRIYFSLRQKKTHTFIFQQVFQTFLSNRSKISKTILSYDGDFRSGGRFSRRPLLLITPVRRSMGLIRFFSFATREIYQHCFAWVVKFILIQCKGVLTVNPERAPLFNKGYVIDAGGHKATMTLQITK